MRRRKPREEKLNHEAWVIPYADLLTLLLAFFVVMYAVSVVNEGKYQVMSRSIFDAFHGSGRRLVPVQGNVAAPVAPVPATHADEPAQVGVLPRLALPLPTRSVVATPMRKGATVGPVDERRNLDRIRDQVRQALQPLIDKHLVVVRPSRDWLEIEIRTDILFPSGVAQLSAQAGQVLHRLAGILAPFPNPLRIEGYTDDVPIDTAVYPSNWELSAARAASVARLFAGHGVAPGRMGIIGWGEYRPVSDNATPQGRNRNRRVLVVVLSDRHVPSRFGTDARTPKDLAHAVGTPPPGAAAKRAPIPEVSVTTVDGDAAPAAAGAGQ